jgi:tRNA pseudouridine38-40 synthase
VRVRLTVAYDGAGFRGFADNPGVRTVGGTLAGAIRRVLGHDVTLTCAGRTDAGVHAWGQVVSFDAREDGLDLAALQRALNALCGPAIAVRWAEIAAPDFDARRAATSRSYRYTVLNSRVPDPFRDRTAWRVEAPLDLEAMRLGCDPLIGEHDFSSFCRKVKVDAGVGTPSLVRRVLDASWVELGDGLLRLDIEASSFCQQMVRGIVGTLVAMGTGRLRAGEMAGIIRARNRRAAGELAPPHGLCLWAVNYDKP